MKPDPMPLRVAKRLIYRTLHAHRPAHPVTARYCGLRLRFDSSSRIGEAIYANAFERHQRLILDQILTPGITVVDVGANIGFYTCLFARKVGPQGRVIAVEPTPASFVTLQENVARNGCQQRVECHQCALSDREGHAALNVYDKGQDVYNTLGSFNALAAGSPVATVDVPTARLDRLLENKSLDNGCFIKIDVEGFEYQVLSGAVDHLRSLPKVALMVELNDRAATACGSSTAATMDLLKDCGFHPYQAGGGPYVEALTTGPQSATHTACARVSTPARGMTAALPKLGRPSVPSLGGVGRPAPSAWSRDVFFFKPEWQPCKTS